MGLSEPQLPHLSNDNSDVSQSCLKDTDPSTPPGRGNDPANVSSLRFSERLGPGSCGGTGKDSLILDSRGKKGSGLMAEYQEEERGRDRFWKSQRQRTLSGTREPEPEAWCETH